MYYVLLNSLKYTLLQSVIQQFVKKAYYLYNLKNVCFKALTHFTQNIQMLIKKMYVCI